MASPVSFLRDTLLNLVTGMGTRVDKTTSSRYNFVPLDPAQLEAAYRGDWVARKIVNIPAFDATRAWRDWQATKDQITKIEGVEKSFNVKLKLRGAMQRGRLYGGGAAVMGLGPECGPSDQELDLEDVREGSLKFLHVVTKREITADQLETNVLSPYFSRPKSYSVNQREASPLKIHPSRVIAFTGAEVLDHSLNPEPGWGDSVLQAVDDAIKQVAAASSGVASLIQEAKVDIIKIPNFMMNLSQKDYSDRLLDRLTLANTAKSMTNALILDKEEEWQRVQANFSTLDDVLKLYLLIVSGAADIPATRMLGQSAVGLNATGDGDLRNYYDRINAEQSTDVSPAIYPLDEVIIRSALGSRPEELFYLWSPLWQMSNAEKAEVGLKKAQAFKVDVECSLTNPEALKEGRENQLIEDGIYPGFEAAIKKAGDAPLPEEDPAAKQQFEAGKKAAAAPTGNILNFQKQKLQDARPRTLYVHRKVLNGKEIVAWAKGQGFKELLPPDDLHVTLAFSKAPIDWMKVEANRDYGPDGVFTVPPGGPRVVELLGEGAVVLMFGSTTLAWRHEEIKRAGAVWEYPEFQPHITVTYQQGDVRLEDVKPYTGKIELGPELFEEIDTNWKEAAE